MVFSKFTFHNFDEKKTGLMIMKSGFTFFIMKPGFKKNRSHINSPRRTSLSLSLSTSRAYISTSA